MIRYKVQWWSGKTLESGYESINKILREIVHRRWQAKALMKQTNAKHILYAVALYDVKGKLEKIGLFMDALSDKEFNRYATMQDYLGYKDYRIYAIHNQN